MVVASIRSKNPGAMWGRTGKRPSADKFVPTNNPLALKWGSTQTEYLSDGLGQGNNIAYFPTYVQGICAQMDLWRSGPKYKNKRFADAISTWSGGNNVPSYIAYVKARVPGITEATIMNDDFWHGPMAVPFLKAQAGHEAGGKYPAPDEDWLKAQSIVLGKSAPVSAPAPVTPKPVVVPKPAPPKSKTPIDDAVNKGLKDLEPE